MEVIQLANKNKTKSAKNTTNHNTPLKKQVVEEISGAKAPYTLGGGNEKLI